MAAQLLDRAALEWLLCTGGFLGFMPGPVPWLELLIAGGLVWWFAQTYAAERQARRLQERKERLDSAAAASAGKQPSRRSS